ncbi:hypothetical protein VMCG_10697 [Cytospora schulzeri]|uniref:Uncharacterized protein n=1 Tax=Cytospora schulzeri TaxID=448051 RepID=A0A423V930_9PEZI|nr:hypothetical protein VMCG_10697 [Valsa malicola]
MPSVVVPSSFPPSFSPDEQQTPTSAPLSVSPLTQTASSNMGSSTIVANPSSGTDLNISSSSITPADQTSVPASQPSGPSPSSTDVQPAPSGSARTTTVHSGITLTTTVSLMTTTGLSTTAISSTSTTPEVISDTTSETPSGTAPGTAVESEIPSCAAGDTSGTDCPATPVTTTTNPTEIASIVVTPVYTVTTASVSAQPPDAGEVQPSDDGQDMGSQSQSGGTTTGDIPSSTTGSDTPPLASGVAGAGTGTGTGSLRTPSGPSSAMSTVQIAGSRRMFESGALLGVAVTGVFVLIHFDGVVW